jgi:hypothetical protein
MSVYRTQLFDCFSDCGILCKVWCCGWTMIPGAENWAGSRRDPCTSCHCCCLAPSMWTRANIRKLRGDASADFCADCCVYVFCWSCALCQDARELKSLGNVASSSAGQVPLIYPMAGVPPVMSQPPPGLVLYPTQPQGQW